MKAEQRPDERLNETCSKVKRGWRSTVLLAGFIE
jgi:hypothetical protein